MTFSFSAINISKETDLLSSGKGVSDEQVSVQVKVLPFTIGHLDWNLACVSSVPEVGCLNPDSLGTISILESYQTNNSLGALSSVSLRKIGVGMARKLKPDP